MRAIGRWIRRRARDLRREWRFVTLGLEPAGRGPAPVARPLQEISGARAMWELRRRVAVSLDAGRRRGR